MVDSSFSKGRVSTEPGQLQYAELVEAILARDSDRACAMMHKHLMTPEPVIARVLESRGLL